MNLPTTIPEVTDFHKGAENMRLALKPHDIQDQCPLFHSFAPGMYTRLMAIPPNTVIVGKIHKHDHIFVLLKGELTIATPEGDAHYVAPAMFQAKAGTQRVVMTGEIPALAGTIHATDITTVEEAEASMVCPDLESFKEHLLCLGQPQPPLVHQS